MKITGTPVPLREQLFMDGNASVTGDLLQGVSDLFREESIS